MVFLEGFFFLAGFFFLDFFFLDGFFFLLDFFFLEDFFFFDDFFFLLGFFFFFFFLSCSWATIEFEDVFMGSAPANIARSNKRVIQWNIFIRMRS
ncbi:MAG: hypothetical protein CMG29_06015 [Candidatus Marinimicrobia bacterium]|nr:hypothetical protein [Candidatus Neomarinimicrobiota bacterium]